MKFYVAGPMRGYPQFNFPMFDEASAYLRSCCHVALSPAEMDRELGFDETIESELALQGFSMEDAVLRDVQAVTASDAILLLPGWEKSSGVAFEIAAAKFLGREIWYYVPSDDPLTNRLRRDDPATLFGHDMRAANPAIGVAIQDGFLEIRTVSDTGGEKGVKPARHDLVPVLPLHQLATLYGKGAEKYAERNWERGYEWSKSYAALKRHAALFWNGQDDDPETGLPHMAAVAFHAFALMQFAATNRDGDDRPTPVALPA